MTERSTACSCACGQVRFELAIPGTLAGYCHCRRCQKRAGAGATASVRVSDPELRFLAGEQLVRGWKAAEGGTEKCFCSVCGAHLFSRDARSGVVLSVRLTAFDDDLGVRPSFRQYVNYAASWEALPDDGLERHGEAKPRP